mgnify:CR=1 FL=1
MRRYRQPLARRLGDALVALRVGLNLLILRDLAPALSMEARGMVTKMRRAMAQAVSWAAVRCFAAMRAGTMEMSRTPWQ